MTLNYVSGPSFAVQGDEYRVRVRLFTDDIVGGTSNVLIVDRFRFALECANGGSVPCTDEGDIIRYIGDGTITSNGCVDSGGLGVAFTTDGVDGPAGPNEVVFTPSSPVVIPAGTAASAGCEVQFDVRVESTPGLDGTPLVVQQAVGYISGDAACDTDPPLESVVGQTGQIRLCPACADGECFDEACNQDTGICERTNDSPDTACGDTDQDACTLARCDGAGACDQDAEQVLCPVGDECFENLCDPADGVCKPSNINEGGSCADTDGSECTTPLCENGSCNQEADVVVCPVGGECFENLCDPADGACKPSNINEGGSCGDTDGSQCTTPLCQGGACNQEAQVVTCDPDGECFSNACDPTDGVCKQTNTPEGGDCTDTDGDACTTAACDGQGSCSQTAIEVVCDDPSCEECDSLTGVCVALDPLPPLCAPPLGCRVTAGGITPDTEDQPEGGDLLGQTLKSTFGGQVGAPCGCIGCFDDLQSVQGSWTHSRKKKSGRFHASEFASLVCGLDDGEGPLPRPAPANQVCFTGVGMLAENGGKRDTAVAFRVDAEDRGEPGAGANAGNQSDVYRIRMWIPGDGEAPEDYLAGICCTNAEPVGVRPPDIDDGEDLIHGNLQIHPVLPNTERGICPPPEEVQACFDQVLIED